MARIVMRSLGVVAALVAGAAARAVDPCKPETQQLPAEGAPFTPPVGASGIEYFELKNLETNEWKRTDDLPIPRGAIDSNQRDRFASGTPAAGALAAIWKVGTNACRQIIDTKAGKRSPGPVTDGKQGGDGRTLSGLSEEECPSTGDPLANCQQCGNAWRARLARELGGRNYSLVVYTEGGDACLLKNGTMGEPIYFAIYSERSTQWDPLRFDPCSIEPDAPAIFVSTPGLKIEGVREAEEFYLRRYPARRCFNAAVNIHVTGKKATTPLLIDHPLQQSQRYRATLQLGAVFTTQHLHSFGLRPATGGTVIFDQGPTGRGTEYQASVVLYALPRNLLSLVGTPYSGRDLINDQGIVDRLGALLGVSLSDPSRRFYAGLSFEILYGVNVTWGIELFRGRELAGVAVGDAFAASDGAIPTRERWDWDKVWGVSIDLLYAKQLFSGRAPQ